MSGRTRQYEFEELIHIQQRRARLAGGKVVIHRPYEGGGQHVNDEDCWCTPVILDWWEIARVSQIDALERDTNIRPN